MHVWNANTGEDVIIDFQGRVGSRADPLVFERDVLGQIEGHAERYAVHDHANQVGYRAITIPRMVKGLGLAAQRYGRLPWKQLLQPARVLARDGFMVSGSCFNNAMYQFNPLPGTPNSIERGKRRITEISPTLVFTDGRLRMVLGAPGGTRILTAFAMTIVNVIDHGMSAVEAVSAPRIYCDGAVAQIEPRLYRGVCQALKRSGESVVASEFSWDPFFCHVQAILIDIETGRAPGASDPRASGGMIVVQ